MSFHLASYAGRTGTGRAGDVLTPGTLLAARLTFVLGTLGALLLAVTIVSAAHGPARIPYQTTTAIVLTRLGVPIDTGTAIQPTERRIVESVRLPRIVVAGLAGSALALAGAVLQGLFRNPLADPGLLGVSAGGALGAVAALTFGWQMAHALALPGLALLGALAAAFAVHAIGLAPAARRTGHPMASLVLAGLAVNAFLGAATSALISFTADRERLREIVFWLLGGFDNRGWAEVRLLALPALAGTVLLLAFARDLNVLSLGDDEAGALGVPVAGVRVLLLAVASLITGAAVAVSGTIAFVGLLVPHGLRLLCGPDHRVLLPACTLGGAAFLILADTVARLAIQPAELRVGIVTSLAGGPFLLFLLLRGGHATTGEGR